MVVCPKCKGWLLDSSARCQTLGCDGAGSKATTGEHWIPTPQKSTKAERVESTRKTSVPLEQVNPDLVGCLVTVRGPELGKRHPLTFERFTIGRDDRNSLVVDLDNVSRVHACVLTKENKHLIEDLGSTNGTYLNDDEIVGATPLKSGDYVRIGGSIFKFLTGGNIDALYHDEIYQITISDGLTRLNNKRYLLEFLEREMGRCHRHERTLCLVLLDVDDFKKLNDAAGYLAGDYVLREIALLLKPKIANEECFARWGGDEFAIVAPENDGNTTRGFAETLRKLVEAHPFRFDSKEIAVAVSIGIAEMTRDLCGVDQLVKVAEGNLYSAQRAGGNRVVVSAAGTLTHRRAIDAEALVELHASRASSGALVAFELGDEREILDEQGAAGWRKLIGALEEDVDACAGDEALLGKWRSRYVVAGLTLGTDPQSLISKVRERQKRETGGHFRAASISIEELRKDGVRALEKLAVRLFDEGQTSSDRTNDLPFPLAARVALVASQKDGLSRFKSQAEAIEGTLRFMVATGIAAIRDRGEPNLRAEVAALLRPFVGRKISFGGWDDLAFHLAPMVPGEEGDPVAASLRALSSGRGRSDLSNKVHQAVERRNAVLGHSVAQSDEFYRREGVAMGATLDALVLACKPFSRVRLMSVAAIQGFADSDGDEDAFRYQLRLHQGPSEHFPIIEEKLSAKLVDGWCYLIEEGAQPLLLSPLVAVRACEICCRSEILFADELCFGPRGAKVAATAVTSAHSAKVEVGWNKSVQALYEVFGGALV